MPINAHPDFLAAEKEYLAAQTKEKKIHALEKMISHAPSHKGAENLRAQLKKRLAKLKYAKEKEIRKISSKSGKRGIRKEEMQAVIIGMTNTGKSSLLSILTNAKPKIASYDFTTKKPVLGTMSYSGTNIQLIEIPAFESEFYDRGLVNSSDLILILIKDLNQIKEIEKEIKNSNGKRIIIFNNMDNNDERKISATLSSKKYNFIVISTKTKQGIENLKAKIFESFGKIRIYTKEPGKEINREKDKPIILEPDSTVKDAAEKILHGFSKNIKARENLKKKFSGPRKSKIFVETKIWGPSSKFPGQVVGLSHKLKDMDIIEFKTR